MWITRRVLAILAVIATLFLVAPAPAVADGCDGVCRDRLVQVGLQGRVVQLVADGESTCALTEAGDVYCWGADYPKPLGPSRSPLLLVTIGALLLAAGTTLLLLSRL
ncbi:RCC1 domain-containing protein [Paractinoplanes globisporus]|uniref:RCC1 domain-containing protein n=1 Tax=Paractinoplanes globisporus TaxID=113565 RepID=A0ABW6WEP0_9ACTN|nr:RCC1 domain-containing protein [Actinoplanes globisporus]